MKDSNINFCRKYVEREPSYYRQTDGDEANRRFCNFLLRTRIKKVLFTDVFHQWRSVTFSKVLAKSRSGAGGS
jgi:hypothetical protein